MSDAIAMASQVLTMHQTGRDFDASTFRLIDKVGTFYRPQVLPIDIERGIPGDCYDHCSLQAAFAYMQDNGRPKYYYVEGWATDPDGIKHLHAWLTDAYGINAYDPTWLAMNGDDDEVPPPLTYYGVRIDILDVRLFLELSDEFKALLANRRRAPEVVAQALGVPIEEVLREG